MQCECVALLRGVRWGCAASADEMALPCTPESTAGMLVCRQVMQTSRQGTCLPGCLACTVALMHHMQCGAMFNAVQLSGRK